MFTSCTLEKETRSALVGRPRLVLPRCDTQTAWKRSKLRDIEHEFPAILFFSRGPQERSSMDGARVAFEAMFRPCRAAVSTHKTRFMEVSLIEQCGRHHHGN